MQPRSKIVLAAGMALLLILGAWYVLAPSKHQTKTAPSNVSQQDPERYQPRNDLPDDTQSPPPPDQSDKPDAGLVYVPGKGWMKKVDDPNALPPPAKGDLPEKKDTEKPEPLRPVTAAWKLKMKTRLLGDMERRIDRIQRALDEARKAGDPEAIHRNEILLDRTKLRTKRLRSDVELLKQQVSNGRGGEQGRNRGQSPEQDQEQK